MALKILSVADARPNLMKIAAICEAIKKINGRAAGEEEIQHVLVQVREHAYSNRSDPFFNDLELPKPDICLEIGSASHSVQLAKLMERLETVFLSERPHVVLTLGNTNSTLACALVAKKIWCPGDYGAEPFIPKVAHVEAGLRGFDRTMPEEINGIVTDSISDYLFTTEESANRNLLRQGVPNARVFFVGNVLIDTLLRWHSKAHRSTILQDLQLANGAEVKPYSILTLQRPPDDSGVLLRMLQAFLDVSKRAPIIFPAHPETLNRIQEEGLTDYFVDHFIQDPELWDGRVRIRLIPQLGYLDFLRLMSEARAVFTDSGEIQDETTMLGVPCITLGNSTNKPVTTEKGTNVLAGWNTEKIITEFERAYGKNKPKPKRSPRYWDGNAAQRIMKVLLDDSHPERSSDSQVWVLDSAAEERSQTVIVQRPHSGRSSPRPRRRWQ
jgi:UDP-N-acetylglucosamine 2-epimerase (non-hydrolysing)